MVRSILNQTEHDTQNYLHQAINWEIKLKEKIFYSSYYHLFLKLAQLTEDNLNIMEFFLTIFIILFFTLLLCSGYLFLNKDLIGTCSDTSKLCLCSDEKKKECEKLINQKA